MKKMDKKGKIKNIRNSEFPPDILLQILLKLPFSNLLNCRLVCKSWKTCISSFKLEFNLLVFQNSRNLLQWVDLDPKHLKGMNIIGSFELHPTWSSSTKRSKRMKFVGSFNLDPTWSSSIGIANTCNGLLCILNPSTERVAILNPMTNEYIELPSGDWYRRYVYGLGFSPKTKQYKIARYSFKNGEVLVEILAFGRSLEDQDHNEVRIQWRHVARMNTTAEIHRHGTYFNGAIYSVGEKGERFDFSTKNVVWRLNVEDEKFEKLCIPKIGAIWKYTAYCGVFNEKLYLSHYSMTSYEYHVWMMDGEGLWERPFSLSISQKFYRDSGRLESYHFQLIKLCEDGKILCLLHSFLLVLYDPKTGKLEKLDQVEEKVKKSFRIYHMNSIYFHSLPNILAGDVATA